MRTIIRQVNNTVKNARRAEIVKNVHTNCRSAAFLLRMVAEGRSTQGHIPETSDRRIAVARVLSDLAANGVVVQNRKGLYRSSVHLTADMVQELYNLFSNEVHSKASLSTIQQYNRNFQIVRAKAIY